MCHPIIDKKLNNFLLFIDSKHLHPEINID